MTTIKTAYDKVFDFLDELASDGLVPVPGEIRDSMTTIEAFIHDNSEPEMDEAALAKAIAEAEWHPRTDYGEGVEVAYHETAYSPIVNALGWECGSCRPDVGWPDWSHIERTKQPDGSYSDITIHVECGHCGNQYMFGVDGSDLT